MRRVCTAAEVRDADAAAVRSVGERTLVDRAAMAVAVRAGAMLGQTYGATVVVLAGPGHNGADALLAGARLAARGAQVRIVTSSDSLGDDLWADALSEALRAGARVEPRIPADPDLVIDGMVGLASSGPLRTRPAELARAVRGRPTLAVDLPSGVDTDTGACPGDVVHADVTVTFDVLKPGLVVGPGAQAAGLVDVVDVGLGLAGTHGLLAVVDADDVAGWVPQAGPSSDKRTRGSVGVVAGSGRYPGAAVLAVGGAVMSGAGYVRYAGPVTASVCKRWPTVVPGGGHVDAVVVGPGLGDDKDVLDRVDTILDSGLSTVIDADGLGVGRDRLRGRATVITPHARELARLMDGDLMPDPVGNPIAAARVAASDLGCIVLLKGATTVVAAPDGQTLLVLTGSPWLSTAGTGDILAGAIGTYLAAGVEPLHAAAAASFVHGLAGRGAAGGSPIAADAVLSAWPDADRSVRTISS